jgi:hypothetical protein
MAGGRRHRARREARATPWLAGASFALVACGRIGFDAGGGGDGSVVIGDPMGLATGDRVVVRGAGFGTKSPAAPLRASYLHPTAAMRFEESGALESASWTKYGDVMIVLDADGAGRRVTDQSAHRFDVRVEYSARGVTRRCRPSGTV